MIIKVQKNGIIWMMMMRWKILFSTK